MKTPISVNVPLRAVPKGNKQKVARRGAHGRMIKGDLTGVLKKTEEEFRDAVLAQLTDEELDSLPWTCPMKAIVTFVYPIADGWPQWKKDAALLEEEEGRFHYESTPDLENIEKWVFDAIEKAVYDNDRRIWKKVSEKRYGKQERILLTLIPVAQARSPRAR